MQPLWFSMWWLNTSTTWPSYATACHTAKRLHFWLERHMIICIYHCSIHNSQGKKWTGNEKVVSIQNKIYSAEKKNQNYEICSRTWKWHTKVMVLQSFLDPSFDIFRFVHLTWSICRVRELERSRWWGDRGRMIRK